MEDIIAPISKELLKAELTEDKRLRMTRQFQLIRPRDGLTLLRANTTFVCIELSSGKAKRLPPEFLDGYGPAVVPA